MAHDPKIKISTQEPEPEFLDDEQARKARREFLRRCGRFAAVTPPAMATLLVVSSVPRQARASTIGWHGKHHHFGFGLSSDDG
jgi:hypothetical protein